MSKHHQVLIIGGGNAGISLAAQLLRKKSDLDIAILDPAEYHYYQPAWTLVGGGVFNINDTRHSEASVIPTGVTWINEAADVFEPEVNRVKTSKGNDFTYDYLVVCPGIQLDWGNIPGLKETLGKNGVCSNYAFEQAPYTFACVKNLKAGQTALFTNPGTPVKCGGAPQKIMYLAADYWRKHGILQNVNIEYTAAGGIIFGVPKYAESLLKIVEEYGINLDFKHNLVSIDGPGKKATFAVTDADGNVTNVEKPFDMIHVTPPQSAPDFIKRSPLAQEGNPLGWIDVDKFTFRHTKYANVFGIGDATNTPNAKTGAAIRKQAPVLVEVLLADIAHGHTTATYNGYGSCPLVVGYGRLILAEFDYDNKPVETFPFNQAVPRWSMYQLKRRVLPWLYWNRILKGTA